MGVQFDRGVIAGMGVLTLLIVANAVVSSRTVESLNDDALKVANAYEVRAASRMTLSLMKDAETGQRGYLITGERGYLEPYDAAVKELNGQVDRLEQLTANDPKQQARMPAIRNAIAGKLLELRASIALMTEQGFPAARAVVRTDVGRIQMEALRAEFQAMEEDIQAMLRDRAASRERSYQVSLIADWLGAAFGLVAILGVGYVLSRHLRSRSAAAAVLHEERELLRTTLASIGDGVIATDPTGAVTFLNPVAQSLTGWSIADAGGRPLTDVFDIVNESTRDRVDNPALRALKEGVIVGLANHTILIARGGAEHPIDDSAAPIRAVGGEVSGAVLVFRDITERKKEEAAAEERARLASLRAATAGVLATTPDVRVAFQRCCELLVSQLGVAFARIWTLAEREGVLLLRASAGQYTHLDGSHSRIALGQFKIGRIASTGRPHLSNSVPDDPNVSDPDWARREGMVAFAGYPLRIEGRVSGVIAVFGRSPLSQRVLTDLAPLAENIAQYIDRRRAEELVREHGEMMRVTLSSIGDAVLTTDENGAVTFLNPVAQGLTGWSQDVAAGRPVGEVFQIVNEQTGEPVESPVGKVLREGVVVGLANHTILIDRDGVRRPIDDSGAPIRDAAGAMVGVVLVFRDVTERRQQEDDLRRLAADLSEADRRKDEFLATLAHELRNPLAPIRNALRLLRQSGHSAEAIAEARNVMERQLSQMVRLVDDLLDVSRITRNNLELRRERVELATLVTRAIETSRPLIEASGHALVVDPIPTAYIDADPVRMPQVFSNLLNNAAKYTERGGTITLSAQVAGDEVTVAVRDTGIGIPAEMLPKVFDIFTQVDRSLERSQGGLGIGLSLVKRLVEMHGGTVAVFSEGDQRGSTFVVRLPVVVRPSGAEAVPEAAPAGPAGRHRILVVDDNEDAARTLGTLLEWLGHTVALAHDGVAGVEAFRSFRPELILLDIGLPKLNGYEACRRIREDPASENVVILALTGWGQESDRRRSTEAGFDMHLVKPVDPDELESLLGRLPELRRKA